MNQGVVRPDGAGGVAQLANGRKTFAKTGTHEDQLVTTGGIITNQIATFVLVGDVQNPVGPPIANIAIHGQYHSYWDGSTIAAPAWRDFMNAYAERKQLPIDNDYGQPAAKYSATSSTVTKIGGGKQNATQPQSTIIQQQNQSLQQQSQQNDQQDDQDQQQTEDE